MPHSVPQSSLTINKSLAQPASVLARKLALRAHQPHGCTYFLCYLWPLLLFAALLLLLLRLRSLLRFQLKPIVTTQLLGLLLVLLQSASISSSFWLRNTDRPLSGTLSLSLSFLINSLLTHHLIFKSLPLCLPLTTVAIRTACYQFITSTSQFSLSCCSRSTPLSWTVLTAICVFWAISTGKVPLAHCPALCQPVVNLLTLISPLRTFYLDLRCGYLALGSYPLLRSHS